MGDVDSSQFSTYEYIGGMTFSIHNQQMKLSNITTIAALIGRSFLIPVPAEARNVWVNEGTDVDNETHYA